MIAVIIGSPISGKTTLLKQLQEKGFNVFHADSFITTEYQKGNQGYQIILDTFGEEFVLDGKVNRSRLKEEIGRDPEFILRLNELIHPLIKAKLEDKDNFIAELPIITSSPIKFNYDKIVLVKADEEVLRKRFKNKFNGDSQEFVEYILNKWDNNIEFDYVVDTSNGYNINKIEKDLLELGLTKDGN